MMIELNNVAKKFGEKTVLQGISAAFHKGELTVISGASGSGKSTLLNIIGGLDSPSEGIVLCDGKDISKDLFQYRAKKVGFVFQEANLISGMSVAQNIQIATELSGVLTDSNQIFAGIAELGIKDSEQKVETLSGGEKQRVAILRSLYKDADFILADEPTGSLDSKNAKIVFEALRKLAEEKGVIVVSHDVELARKYADRMITIQDGRIIDETVIRRKTTDSLTKSVQKDKKEKILRNVIIPLGKNSVRIRRIKFLSIIATIAMAITAVTMVLAIACIGDRISDNVNVNYLESDLLHVFYGHTPNAEYGNTPFTDADREYFENHSSIREVVWKYYKVDGGWFFHNNVNESEASIKQINLNEFFRERIMSNDIIGAFPQKSNEIILAEDVAKRLFGNESALGQNVVLCGPSGQNVVCSVVGVNRTKNPYDEILTFISADLLKNVLNEELCTEVFVRQTLDHFREEVTMGFKSGGMYGSMQIVDGQEELIYGAFPVNDNEILVSSTVLAYCIGLFDIEGKYTPEDVLNGNISSADFETIKSTKLAIDFNGVFEVYISGVYDSDSVEFRYTADLVSKLQEPNPIDADIYVKNPSKALKVRDQINKNREFEVYTNQDTLKHTVMSQSVYFGIAVAVLGFILICVSVLLLNSYSKIAVLERKKEIAILKSLGAKDRTVLGVLLFDSCVIVGFAILCALMLLIFARFFTERFVAQISYVSFSFLLLIGLLVGMAFAGLVLLLTIIEMYGFVRKMPAELLQQS